MFLFLAGFVNAELNVLNQVESIYNINEKIPLKVVISYSNEIEGFVKSSAICDNAKLDYFVTPFTLKTNPQELVIPDLRLTRNMVGKCSLEVSLTDSEDNLLDKKVIKILEVSPELILTIELNKDKLSPNDELKINGNVKNVRGELINTGKVKILLDDNEFASELNKGEFSYTYQVPSNIKSNTHPLKISFDDNYGNKASKEFSIFINPKPTMLKILLNKIDFLPGERVNIETLLYDQANDLIENNAEIKIFNPENDLIRNGNYKLEFVLDQYALPGSWLIKAKTDDFKIESRFNVGEVKKVQTYIEDGILYIKNIGNIIFDDSIKVMAIGENGKEFTKKIKISPKETKSIKLSNELKQGQYNLNVLTSNQKESFDDIKVPESDDPIYLTGKAVSETTNTMIDRPYIPIIIILVLLLFFYFRNASKKKDKFMRERDFQQAYAKAREIEKEKISSEIKPRKFNIDEKEAKDFRERMLKNINQKKSDEQGYLHRNQKDKGGSFGVFD